MDPNWRGAPPPSSGTTYFHTFQLHPVQDRTGQRLSPGGSPIPMELDPTSTVESGAVPYQAGVGPNPGFQGQGHQFVGQGHGMFGYGPFLQQPQGRPVMGMSRPPELSDDVVPDCPDFVDQNMTLVSVPAMAASSQYPYPYVPGNMVFVPQGGTIHVQYPVGTQIVPQDPVGVHQMMSGPPLVMDRPQGVGLVPRVPYSNVPMVNPVPPNPSGQPVLAVPHSDAAEGGNRRRMEIQRQRPGKKTVPVRWSPHEVRLEDSARQRGHSGHSGLHNVAVNSATDVQNPSVTMGPNDTTQPSWMQEQQQRPPSVQAPPTAHPLSSYQQPNRPMHQIRHPAQPRSSAAPVVRTSESTCGPGVSESVVQREMGQERGQPSDTDRTVEPSDEADISSLRVSQEEEPSPMETGTPPELPDVKLPSLLNVHIRKKGAKGRMRDLVHQFVASSYRELWHRTYCVPQKTPVSQHHPDKALVRTREGEFRVSLAMEQMSIHNEEHLFVLGDYHYEGFLHHLSPSQVDVRDEGLVTQLLGKLRKEQQFGDFDLLLFHPRCGLMVLGLCSVNSNSDVQYILKRVQKARNQLDRSVAVAKRYVETLDLRCPVTRVFCTPNLKRPFLAKVTGRDKHTDRALQAANVLCSEQLPAQFRTQWLTAQSFSVLLKWWAEVKSKEQKVAEGQLSLEDLTLLLGCFLCPSLSKVDFDQTSPMPPSESRPLIQEVSGDASSYAVPAQKREPSESPRGELNTSISNLYLSIGSLTKSFTQYMDEYVDLYFPHHLSRTYRVPPIHFNIQKIDKKGSYDTLDAPMSKDTRGDEGENRVVSAIEILSMKHEAARPVFIICDFQYNHYLNKLKESMFVKGDDRRPRRAFGQSVRAQHDCLLIHRRHGIIIISVKAVGDNFDTWASSGSDKLMAVQRTLGKVLKQLPREEAMVKMVLEDLTSDLPCIKLIALPNLSRQDVDAAVNDDNDLKQGIQAMFPAYGTQAFLCKDELCEANENIWETYEQRPDFLSGLISWWDRSVGRGKGSVLSKQLYKQIIGRFCGLLSTVEIWSTHTPRIEVRNLGEAVQETGERYSRILLTQEQLEILLQPSRLVYLSGPPGTGKTMLLVLRAQRWAEEGHQVVILNLYFGSLGLPLGHLLQRQVTQRVQASSHNLHPQDSKDGGGGQSRSPNRHHAASSSSSAQAQSAASSARSTPTPSTRVWRIDLDNRVFEENKPGKLAEIPEGAYIVVDEITHLSHPVLSWVVGHRKPRALWCAGQFKERCPEGFEPFVLSRILRCPPTVQRILQHTSYDLGSVGKETREASYVLSSAPYGLATDGARPRFIFHSGHNSPSPSPLSCSECGQELAELLTHQLHLQHSTYDLAKDRKLGPLPMSGGSLSLRDVVIVSKQAEPCAFITALKKRGLTVSVVTGTANPMVAVPTHETIVFTTPPAMTGLERKVVVYVPFQSRDVLEEKEGGEGEEREDVTTDDLRVRQVLDQLTPDDRVLLWYMASRCLSQLVVVVP